MEFGININLSNIRYFGLNEKETVKKYLSYPIKRVRIPIPFDEVNPEKNVWDFKKRDWLLEEVLKKDIAIDLQIGIKTINWPEVHAPKWLIKEFPYLEQKGIQLDKNKEVQKYILEYLQKVSKRYLQYKEIASIQVENEPFSKHLAVANYRFISKQFNKKEVQVVKNLDPYNRPFLYNIPLDTPQNLFYTITHADILGLNIYNQYYLPMPPFFYWNFIKLLTLAAKIMGKKVFVTEYQTAPWLENHKPSQPFSKEIFLGGLEHFKKAGIKTVLLWDVEQVLAQGIDEHKQLLESVLA